MSRSCRRCTFNWTNMWRQSSSESKVMQWQVKDDVLQEHPAVNDTLFPFATRPLPAPTSRFLCLFDRTRLSSTDTTWLQGDSVVLALNEFQTLSRARLDLHIQILQSNFGQSVADFHNRTSGFGSLNFVPPPSCLWFVSRILFRL